MMDLTLSNLSKLNMDILVINDVSLNHSWRATDVRSSFTRVYMVTKGIGWLRFDSTSIKMTPGNTYLVPAGFKFSYDCEDGFSKVYFHISLPLPNGCDILDGLSKCIEFPFSHEAEIIARDPSADTVSKVIRIKSYLYSLVCKCMEFREDQDITNYSPYTTRIISYIEKNLSVNLTVEKIADALFTSASKIRKTFREDTGISIGKYIDDRIMFIAELEIQNKKLTINEISEKLGFCDQFYFSRCFSKKYGVSPIKYRKEQLYK